MRTRSGRALLSVHILLALLTAAAQARAQQDGPSLPEVGAEPPVIDPNGNGDAAGGSATRNAAATAKPTGTPTTTNASATATANSNKTPIPNSTAKSNATSNPTATGNSTADIGEPASAPDDPDAQAEVDRSAAELEAVRRAEEKAGLLPQEPGAGLPRDPITRGLPPWGPLGRDIASAQGSSLDGAPLADPAPSGGAQVRLTELAGISEEELRAKYDIPVELNDAVVAYIRFFQTDAREHFSRWLARSRKFMPLMRSILERQRLPLDLVYLSMIESGFNAYAYSFAKAAGLWQFVVGTARRYGLHRDFWVDERRDPVKATEAAGKYLTDLQQRFRGNWYLAWAGYNAGEGRIDRAIRRESTHDFWRMMQKGRTLRAETKHYVPKLIAAALIAKHPERFGFHVDYEEPWDVEEVFVPDATDLRVVAKAAGVSLEKVRELNPELRRFCTPPGGWTVRLPKGTKETFVAAYEKLDPSERLSFTTHVVERGEPLAKIALAYGVPEHAILRTNGLKSYRQVRVGKVLVIPMSQSRRGLASGRLLDDSRPRVARVRGRSAAAAAPPAKLARAKEPAQLSEGRGTTYKVQPGDSLWSIAAKFSTTVEKLKRLNGLNDRRARSLQVGQKIAVKEEKS